MITRFYVDNYKCLQNFEYKPKPFELVVGANGTGKSTVFEALDKVRRFVSGEGDALAFFPKHCGTRWDTRPNQIFEIDFTPGVNDIQYHLEINLHSASSRVEKETIKRSGNVVFESLWEESMSPQFDSLFKNDSVSTADYTFEIENTADEFHINENRVIYGTGWQDTLNLSNKNSSFLTSISPQLSQILQRIVYIKINPPVMVAQIKRVQQRPEHNLSNFSSYYLYLLQQKQGAIFELLPYLREAIPDFDSFAVAEDFEEGRRFLQILPRFKKGSSVAKPYSFDELSDGQRALIGLYTLLFCTLEEGVTLVIDEPENYIALRELQPWLMLLQERLEEKGGQVILISHHPEFINMLAPENGVVFERDAGGPVRIKSWEQGNSPLAPAEIMARGWEA